MSGMKRDEAGAEGISFSVGLDAERQPASERDLPWSDSDFARISKTITRAAPPEPESAPELTADEPVEAEQGDAISPDEKGPVEAESVTPAPEANAEAKPDGMQDEIETPETVAAGSDKEAEAPAAAHRAPERDIPEHDVPKRDVPERDVIVTSDLTLSSVVPSRTEAADPPQARPMKEPGHNRLWAQTSTGDNFPRLIRLKGAMRAPGEMSADPDTFRMDTFHMDTFRTDTFHEERTEPRFGEGEPHFGSPAPDIEFRAPVDDLDDRGRVPPRFGPTDDEEPETPRAGIVPEPIIPNAAFERGWNDTERRSPVRWLLVAVAALGFGYGAVEALGPRIFTPGGGNAGSVEQARVAALQPGIVSNANPIVPNAPAANPALVPQKPAAHIAPSVSALKSPARTNPQEQIASVIVPPRPATSRAERAVSSEETPRNEIDRGPTPDSVVLAPGPRDLAGSVPLPASATATASGDLVTEVQGRLTALGYSPGPINGYLTASTRNALLRFQRDARLPMTGEIDGRTWSKLRHTHRSDLRLVTGPAPVTP